MVPILAGAAAGAAGSAISSIANYYAQKNAAREQRRAADQAGQAITGAYNQATGYFKPYYEQGLKDYGTLGEMVRGGQFNVNDQFNYDQNADPGAQFRMQQGLEAINTNAAARGGGLSGATLKALTKYGSGLASQEYQAAYDRFANQRNFNQAEQARRYGMRSDLAGYGTQAASNLGQLATGYGSNMADLAIQRGNVNAMAAQVGPNAWNQFGQQLGSVSPYLMGYGLDSMTQPKTPRQSAQKAFDSTYGNYLPKWLK